MSAIYDLESYFAKAHTAKFIELGSSYIIPNSGDEYHSTTPMEDYFVNGLHKELNDEHLNQLYHKAKDTMPISEIVGLLIFVLFVSLAYMFGNN